MLKSACRETRERMHNYLDGDISPMDEKAMRDHVARCRDCAPAFERLRQSDRAVRSHYEATVANAAAPDTFWQGVSDQLPAQPRRARRRRADLLAKIPRRILAPAAVAAALMLAVWGLEMYETASPERPGRSAPVRKELAKIRASILDMEAELEQQWR